MAILEIQVQSDDWRNVPDVSAVCEAALNAVVIAAPGPAIANPVVSLLLTDDAAVQALNKTFRGKDAPTDVLSFPADPMDRPQLGDIAIAYGVTARDAGSGGKLLGDHLSHLVIHGYLHLLGHDHIDEAEATRMEGLEIDALASLGMANPYIAA